jgi:adenosylcobinamide-GDP ribazoletransferase
MRVKTMTAPPDLAAPLRAASSAVTFLTRVPLPASWCASSGMVAGAPAFPLVGALLGAVVGATTALLARVEPAPIAAAIAVAIEILLTGALHLDGLGDSADSFGARERERALEIMRDHSLGTYGVSAIVIDLLLKTVALSALAHSPLAVAVAALSLSRAVPLPIAAALPYARPEQGGTGRLLSERLSWRAAVVGVVLACAIAIGALRVEGLALVGAAALVALTVGVGCRRRLGGVTGDTLGAAVEVSATVCLVVAAGWVR